MAEVVGEDKTVAKYTACPGCGAKIKYFENDVKMDVRSYYDGSTDVYDVVKCPRCDYKIEV